MKTLKNLPIAGAIALALFAATPAVAALPGREVRINTERFAQLAPQEQQEVLALKVRLEELIAVDRSTITPEQRAAMRTEWKELKREMRAHNDGVHGNVLYISTGALIIIILLLIIIL